MPDDELCNLQNIHQNTLSLEVYSKIKLKGTKVLLCIELIWINPKRNFE